MQQQIIRTKTKAAGGITEREKELMDAHARLWIARAMRTDPIEPDKIIPAIERLYAVAGLKKPRVVIVPSPLVMAFAYGAAAAIRYIREHPGAAKGAVGATAENAANGLSYKMTFSRSVGVSHNATNSATDDASRDAVAMAMREARNEMAAHDAIEDAITRAADQWVENATEAASRATVSATLNASDDVRAAALCIVPCTATLAETDRRPGKFSVGRTCYELAGILGIACAERWHNNYQGGNMWAGQLCYLTAFRDILGLELPEHAALAHWEQAAIHGGFRIMHEEFCMVCDFPEVVRTDHQHRPHCESGPSFRWRDGWSLYHWHGTRIPAEWIEKRESLTAAVALAQDNLELRRAACDMLGWPRILAELNAKTIDSDPDPQIGELVEVQLPDLPTPSKFLRVRCGTGREFAIGVPPQIATALDAQAWIVGLEPDQFERPDIRV